MTHAMAQAMEVYDRMAADLWSDVLFFMRHGIVYATDRSFWLVRRHPRRSDAWAVQLAVGPLAVLERVVPYTLPYIAWGRCVRGRDTEVLRPWDRCIRLFRQFSDYNYNER